MFALKIVAVGIVLTAILATLALMILARTAARPGHLGLKDGRLAPCSSTPNCVSSQSSDQKNFIEPIFLDHSEEEAIARLMTILGNRKDGKVITARKRYVHVEFRSRLFGFVDDAEFYLDEDAKVLHFRSAARVGYSDLGVNRKRLEDIRKAFLEMDAPSVIRESP
ncbi:DUF1499 domain-containing protein [Acidobacteriota bacterium]